MSKTYITEGNNEMKDKKRKDAKSNVNVEIARDISPNSQELKNKCNQEDRQRDSSKCENDRSKR